MPAVEWTAVAPRSANGANRSASDPCIFCCMAWWNGGRGMNQAAANGQESILSDVKPSKAIVKLAVPATLALLAKAVYNIVDTAYIGMLDSDIALAAVGVTLPLLLIMVSVENIFAAGAAVLAGRQLGANDREGANRTVTTIAGLSTLIGGALCVLGILFMEPLLRAFGASEAVLPKQRIMRSGCSSPPFLICPPKASTVRPGRNPR